MKVAVFGAKQVCTPQSRIPATCADGNQYDIDTFDETNDPKKTGIEFEYLEPRLDVHTAPLAEDHDGVCVFVNDKLDEDVLKKLKDHGVVRIAPAENYCR